PQTGSQNTTCSAGSDHSFPWSPNRSDKGIANARGAVPRGAALSQAARRLLRTNPLLRRFCPNPLASLTIPGDPPLDPEGLKIDPSVTASACFKDHPIWPDVRLA